MFCRCFQFLLATALVTVYLATTSPLCAQLSPGPLSTAHRQLDSPLRCTECHVFGAGQPVFKCSDCHLEIGKRVSAQRGYHGEVVDPAVAQRDCAKCHREHVGRTFELVYWPKGQERFDHDETGYPLVGSHRRLKCRDCHSLDFVEFAVLRRAKVQDPSRSFLGLKTACGACHDDEHRGRLGVDCKDCHGFETWADVSKFDHDRTEFVLTGRHTNVECVECHVRAEDGFVDFEQTRAPRCRSCHDDPHQGAFSGHGCDNCHSTGGWELVRVSARFDHSQTDFPLVGRHADVRCRECHVNAEFAKPVQHQKCLHCHDDDPHGGQLTGRADQGDCGACHNEEGFTPTTYTREDHADSEYPLTGKHLEVECERCHEPRGKETVFRAPFGYCTDCHVDSHEGEFSGGPHENRCEDCHTVSGFRPSSFTITHHQETRFPLIASHLAVPCSGCHRPPEREPAAAAKAPFHFETLACPQCHEHPHGAQFSGATTADQQIDCETCHTGRSWDRLKLFDHGQTEFPLEDAHRTVGCAGCHSRDDGIPGFEDVVFKAAPRECSGCHNDVHAGQFSRGARAHECSVCHTNVDWRPTRFDHEEHSAFSLDGAHKNVPCGLCHSQAGDIDGTTVRVYRGAPRKCEECHGDAL